jgi:excinuclease UvrABC nuclease subunit
MLIMSTLDHLKEKIQLLSDKYNRHDLNLEISDVYDIKKDFSKQYPNSEFPGVYVFLDEHQQILYVGKASYNNYIGPRLGAYFKRGNEDKSAGVPKVKYYEAVRYLVTIKVPENRAFEAPAIEEFLIKELNPPLNVIGRMKGERENFTVGLF